MEALTNIEKERAYKLEKICGLGEEIHFSSEFVDGIFLLKKPCNHRGGVCSHEFGIYHSHYDGNIYFHRCDNCTYSVRITEDYYNKAKRIHDTGGDYID